MLAFSVLRFTEDRVKTCHLLFITFRDHKRAFNLSFSISGLILNICAEIYFCASYNSSFSFRLLKYCMQSAFLESYIVFKNACAQRVYKDFKVHGLRTPFLSFFLFFCRVELCKKNFTKNSQAACHAIS